MPGYTPDSSTVRVLTPELKQYFLRCTDSPADAEELAQDVWIVASNFRGESSLRHYLFRVARNLTAEWYRRRYRRPYTLFGDFEGGLGSDVFGALLTSLGSKLQMADDLAWLRRAIDSLEEPFRETVRMHLKGLDSEQIAQQLGVSSNTVRSRLARARKVLRRIFEAQL